MILNGDKECKQSKKWLLIEGFIFAAKQKFMELCIAVKIFLNSLRIFAKKVVEVQIDGIPVVNNEENSKSGNPQLRAQ